MKAFRPIAVSALGVTAGLAQPPETPAIPPQPPVIPGAPGQPAPPAQPPAAQQQQGQQDGQALANTKIVETIFEPKLSGTALAGLYRKYTGRRVIVSAQAATAEFSFVQEASQEDPLTYADAAELLKKAATVENFIFVPDASDPNLDILTFASGGLNPRGRGIAVYTESDTLPEGDAVITYVMNLQFLKPDAAVSTFQQVVGQFGAYGSIAPVANASAVIITENTSLIRRLIDLKKEIDVPGGKVATRFIKVEYADVTELAATLNELLTAQQTAQRTAGVQRTQQNNAPAPIPGNNAPVANLGGDGGSGGTSEENPPQIVPEPRTNRIFVMGRPVDILFIEGLVREFDVETDRRNFLRRKLSFVKVSEFLPIARDALTRAFTSGTDASGGGAAGAAGGAGGAGGAGAAGGRTTTTRSTSSSSRGMASTSSNNFGGAGGGGGGGSSLNSGGLSEDNVSTAPLSELVGRTLLVADNITNSVVIQGPPASLEIIEQLLDQIDVKADQVMLSCVFGQLTLTDNWSFGMDYVQTLGSNHAAGRGGSGSGGTTAGLPLNPATAFAPGTLSGSGLGVYGNIGNNLNVYLNAKQDDSSFKVLSRPTIFTANNKKGSIISGTQIAVPTSSYSSGTSSTNSTNFEYKDVALQLEVIPLINSSKEVTLQIYLTSDDIGQDRPVGTGANEYVIPDILKRELITTVTVPNNETVVLGGLITETLTDGRSGIPILHRLPLVGPLFGTKNKDKDRSELLIFIQPSIVSDNRTLDAAQVDMDSRYKTAPETRRFSEGPGVLPPADVVPVNDKAGKQREAVIVDPPAKKNAYPYGTRFRTGAR